MKKVILISGKARNGKDTFALFLKDELEKRSNKKVLKISFGDLVKFVCYTYLGWDGEKNEAGRTMLQYVGTDLVRKKDPSFWVRWVNQLVKIFENEFEYCIIPDVRFKNEIDFSNDWDKITVRVNRVGFESPLTKEQQSHSSENEWEEIDFDVTVYASSLQELRANAIKLIEEKNL